MPVRLAVLRLAALLSAALAAGCACGSMRDVRWSPSAPPDEQYQTGTTHGFDVVAWRCVNGRHVVVSRYSSEYLCLSAKLETAPCGTPTDVETRISGEPRRPQSWW